jgi:hypothetical protein
MALPPAANISAPALEANGWLLTTMPRLETAGIFWHSKLASVLSRQFPLMPPAFPMHGGEHITRTMTGPVLVRIGWHS